VNHRDSDVPLNQIKCDVIYWSNSKKYWFNSESKLMYDERFVSVMHMTKLLTCVMYGEM
jgi:hypothetical protein